MLEWEGKKYCTAKEAAALLNVSRGAFYLNVKNCLDAHELPARKRSHYLLVEVEKHKKVTKIARKVS